MTIRAVLMWYIGVLVVVGGSGAAGYTALTQHRAPSATQVAALPTEPPATQVTMPPTTLAAAQPATQVAKPTTTQVAAQVTKPPAAKAAVQLAATAPVRHPSPARHTAPAASTWADASALLGPLPPLPRALPAHNVSTRHVSHSVVASSHRHGLYAAAREPSAPRVTYYAYPGYYPYQPAYAYYSYYPRYPY